MAEYIKIYDRIKKLCDNDKNIFNGIKDLVNEWDPIDVLWCLPPSDEYDSEAWDIFEIVKEDTTDDKIIEKIDKYFSDYFEANSVAQEEQNCFELFKKRLERILWYWGDYGKSRKTDE